MLRRLIPREDRFFDLFNKVSDLIVEGAKEFRLMLDDPKHSESHSRAIKEIEIRADDVTHRTVELLHQIFITPIDRGDIHQLITRLDDILDFIEAASQRLYLYDIKASTPTMIELADIIVKSCEDVRSAVQGLEGLKNPTQIIKHCVEVNRLENEADHTLRAAMALLFKEEPDVRQLIKLKELYELLETVTDCCEDVANIVESIVLEYA